MREIPANTRIQLGPGVFQTRGFAPNDTRGWQPKSGQKIIGAGVDVTTLQLVGAENTDQHYHAIGMPIEPTGTTPITPFQHFVVSDLTIDCNVDNQPARLDWFPVLNVSSLTRVSTLASAAVSAGHGLQDGDTVVVAGATGPDANLWNGLFRIGNVQPGSFDYLLSGTPAESPATGTITARKVTPYPNVACGAVRVMGSFCLMRRIKAINWGTKSLKQGCFVISIIDASGKPTDDNHQPLITETIHSWIEDCIAIQPSKNNARETTVLHIGGLKNTQNHAQGFGQAPFIRRNFVDCAFSASVGPGQTGTPFSSAFISSKTGTGISGATGIFIGKRQHFRDFVLDAGTFLRFCNPNDPMSQWNGFFQIAPFAGTADRLTVLGLQAPNMTTDSSLVIMGTEFRGIAISSGIAAVVEQNVIRNCWIGGPYGSPLDDSVSEPATPPTLAREERLDPLNALNTRSLIVRGNTYFNVAVGPYWNMGGVSGLVADNDIAYDSATGIVTVTTDMQHKLWVNARVKLESAPDSRYEGIHEITAVPDETHLQYRIAPGQADLPATGTAGYRVVSGVDFLVIEGNQIDLADLDETEFAIKNYPLAGSGETQIYRACGIVVGDNELSTKAGAHAHRQVFIRRNRIRYLDGRLGSMLPGIGDPTGAGMQLAGIKQLHVTDNVLELNAPKRLHTFRCGKVRFFNNQKPTGEVVPGWVWEWNDYCDEPATLAEDAFILTLLGRKRGIG